MKSTQENAFGWGHYPVIKGVRALPDTPQELVQNWHKMPFYTVASAMRRSYGDAALLSSGLMISPLAWQEIYALEDGILSCEAGCTLDSILQFIVPKGWFLPVTPGTKWISIGGAIASDVHGKDHFVSGAFSNYVLSFELLSASGEVVLCSRNQNAHLFWATLAGYGLTGIILSVKLRLKRIPSTSLKQSCYKVHDLAEMLHLFEQKSKENPFAVAWIDALAKNEHLGRGHLLLANWVEQMPQHKQYVAHKNQRITIPPVFSGKLLNHASVKAFNTLFYHKQQAIAKNHVLHYNPYFYPLDKFEKWYRLYGKSGFVQYQFVLPQEAVQEGMKTILARISTAGFGAFLGVLKKMGNADNPLLAFPMQGYSLALDFKRERRLLAFLSQLDQMVIDYGGRVYLAKDARLDAESFAKMYPNAEKWKQIKAQIDPQNRFQSELSKRLLD
jgi:decaprenylphospho-beta-D-ribofuranose 2-oxidase